MAIDEPQPPYGLSYTSPGPPLFNEPFITASNGQFLGNPFPLTFPPLNASASHPNSSVNFQEYIPQAGMTAPVPWNTYPYNENYFFSIERQINESTLFSVSYVGSQAHHLLVGVFRESGQPGSLSGFEQAQRRGAGIADVRAVRRGYGLHYRGRPDHSGYTLGPGAGLRKRRLRREHREFELQFPPDQSAAFGRSASTTPLDTRTASRSIRLRASPIRSIHSTSARRARFRPSI